MTSAELILRFDLSIKACAVTVLSLFNDTLLTTCSNIQQLFVYNTEGNYLLTLITQGSETVFDAVWTPQGNIVYTKWKARLVMVITQSGDFIAAHSDMPEPQQLSVSNDKIVV